jgi:hypothetical protein
MARLSGRPTRAEEKSKRERAADIFFTAMLLDIIAHATGGEPPTQERIDPIDENQPPFFRFWKKLNAGLAAAGKPDTDHRTAMTAFEGGPTPVGALTFIGKQWDGIRAVPTGYANGYNGEFRQVTEDGTIWRMVHSHTGPREFTSAEGALYSARQAKKHSEDHFVVDGGTRMEAIRRSGKDHS